MKKLSFLLILSFLATSIFAQGTMEEKAAKATAKMTKSLDLTAEQQAQIEQIYLNKYAKKAELKANKATDKAARKADRKSMQNDVSAQIDAVLTEEQKAKRATLKAERKEKKAALKQKRKEKKTVRKADRKAMKGKAGKFKGMTPEQVEARAEKATANMTKRLDLTAEQQVQVRAAYTDYYNNNVAFNAKKGEGDKKAMKAERKQMHKDFRTQIDNLLTDEQRAKRNGKRQHQMKEN